MEKEQKKLSITKLVIVLLLVGLLLTSVLSRTLAKYITQDVLADDTVRVAKWGVVIDATGELFKEEYVTDDGTYSGTLSVEANDLVFAPGTSGQTAGVTLSGTPEVASRITITDNGSALNGWDYTGLGDAERVQWTFEVDGVARVSGGSFQDLLDALTDEVIDLAPNTDLGDTGFNISWAWPFNGDDDAADTYYGDKATAPTVSFDLDITIVQID